jgi:hypothetical protein
MTASRGVKTAIALSFVLAFCLWNVVFDRAVVTAGRQYVYAASEAPRLGGPPLRVDDWMSPAVSRGIRSASLVSGGFLAASLIGIVVVSRRPRRGAPREEPTCAP